MNDLSQTIAPRSDQLNADDLIGGPRTIKVRQVSISKGADQPASIFFEGDDGKPYKPGLSMRRWPNLTVKIEPMVVAPENAWGKKFLQILKIFPN